MLVLGIESTCDETGAAVVKQGKEIFSNVVASQHDIHSKFGGVFPELASRRHVETMIPVIDEALNKAKVTLQEIDLIAVANGPGLVGALLMGLNAAKTLAFSLKKPFIGINHVEAHLYAAIMSSPAPPPFPCLGVVLSGAHTSLVYMPEMGRYELLGQTIDDAIGEAFDKVAKVMGLPYPGGPKIEALARRGDPDRYPFKAGKVKGKPFHFSFSGIKTGVLYTVKGQNGGIVDGDVIAASDKPDIAASFQQTVFSDVISKTVKAAKNSRSQSIVFGGGVTNNRRLREMFSEAVPPCQLYWPSEGLSLDNAAMIAGLGYHCYRHKELGDHLDLEALPRIGFH
ncbi:MAG: tRNA (adenosine(37)-N6)-threonylcarbamoyltransferase complex transferase subunit TsaD [Waddliaceae bacterium]